MNYELKRRINDTLFSFFGIVDTSLHFFRFSDSKIPVPVGRGNATSLLFFRRGNATSLHSFLIPN